MHIIHDICDFPVHINIPGNTPITCSLTQVVSHKVLSSTRRKSAQREIKSEKRNLGNMEFLVIWSSWWAAFEIANHSVFSKATFSALPNTVA